MIRSELQDIKNRLTGLGDEGSQNLTKIIFKTAKSTVNIGQHGVKTDTNFSSGRRVITGWIYTDFSMSGTASSSPINELGLLKAAGKFNTYTDKAGDAIEDIVGGDTFNPIRSIRSVMSLPPAGTQIGGVVFSEEVWEGSSKPAFSVNLCFVNTDPEDDILNDCLFLQSSILPSDSTPISISPPTYFKNGQIDVKIGNWFWAQDLVVTSVNAVYSRETVKSGQPLYANVAVSFKAFSLVTAATYATWFPLASKPKSITIMSAPGLK